MKDERGRAYRLPAKIIGNVVHEVKQNKENQESAVLGDLERRNGGGCGERVVREGAARGSDSAHGSGRGKTGRCWAAFWRIRGSWMRTREGMGKNTPRASRILRIRKRLGQDMRSGGDATRGC